MIRIMSMVLSLFCVALAANAVEVQPKSNAQVTISMRIYQVATDITGDGLTSQTLEGSAGTFQVLHERWGKTRVRMKGNTLEAPLPHQEEAGIKLLAAPRVTVAAGETAGMGIGEPTPLQYLEPVDATTFKLRELDMGELNLGIRMTFKPELEPGSDDLWQVPFQFSATYSPEREAVPGLGFNVGKPIIESVSRDERITLREGEYAAYRTQGPGKSGMLYVFFKAERYQPAEPVPAEYAISIETRVLNTTSKLEVNFHRTDNESSLLSLRMSEEAAQRLLEQLDTAETELLSAPRITLHHPAKLTKVVLREPQGEEQSAARTALDRADGLRWMYRALSPQGILPENFDALGRGVIADISEHGEGILVSIFPELLQEDEIRLDYLFQLKREGLFEEFRQTFRLGTEQTQVFVLPHEGEQTLFVMVDATLDERPGHASRSPSVN